MNSKKDVNTNTTSSSQPTSKYSKAFQEGLAELFNEIQLAVRWNRPSILLVVQGSRVDQDRAQKALEKKLSVILRSIIHIDLHTGQHDLFHLIEQNQGSGPCAYFVQGVGENRDTYHALNLYRENLVDQKIIIVFWLTHSEAEELPRFAPDFWAFRHRVIEFAPSLGSRKSPLPSGLFLWHSGNLPLEPSHLQEQIRSQEAVLLGLPSENEALMLRLEAMDRLAYLYWLADDSEKAGELLQQGSHLAIEYQIGHVEAGLRNGLAILAYEREQYGDALENLEKALQLSPGDERLWANRAIVQYSMGRRKQLLKSMEQAMSLSPRSAVLNFILGFIHFMGGNPDIAQGAFEKAMEFSGDYFPAHCALAVLSKDNAGTGVALPRMKEWNSNVHEIICWDALTVDTLSALDQLRHALADQKISQQFVKRDPTLMLVFDEISLKSALP